MLRIEEITNIENLRQLGSVWNPLLSQSRSDSIFLTWEWVFNWWQVYGQGKELCVLVLKGQNGDIIAIAPFYVRKKKVFKSFSTHEVRFLGTGEDVSPDYLDLIIMKDREEEAINAFMEYISRKDGWDVLNLTDMLSTSISYALLKKAAADNGFIVESSECATCPYIQIPSSWEDYIEGLSKNMRYNVKRRIHNLEKNFKTRYFMWQDIEGLQNAMERLAFLHHKRWEEKSSIHSFSSKEYNTFHQAVAKEFVSKGWLQLSCLELNGEIAGILYDYRYKNKIYYYQGGFDPSFYKYSLGLVLRAYVIQKAIEDGIKEIDLLKGGYDHKYKWTESDRQTINLVIGKGTLRSNLFFFNTFKKPQIKSSIKKVLPAPFLKLVRSSVQ
jgi:CelD/BcsL family acetyltransferase involved in cellulose biosynthesis